MPLTVVHRRMHILYNTFFRQHNTVFTVYYTYAGQQLAAWLSFRIRSNNRLYSRKCCYGRTWVGPAYEID